MYQSQNRKGREILPSLSYHSNENNRQMEDDILKSVTYGGHWRLIAPEKYLSSCVCKLNYYAPKHDSGFLEGRGACVRPILQIDISIKRVL